MLLVPWLNGHFEARLAFICENFERDVMKKEICEQLQREAVNLVEEINEETNKEADEQIIEAYRKVKQEAEAVADFIGSIGHCSNTILTYEKLNLASKRIRYRISNIGKGEFCIEMITISIGSYVCILAQNNSPNNYSIEYQWKTSDGRAIGNGKMGLPSRSVRAFYDNRERNNQKLPRFSLVKCQTY